MLADKEYRKQQFLQSNMPPHPQEKIKEIDI
jgi:hypothetical protein